jgi:hypothetical protein
MKFDKIANGNPSVFKVKWLSPQRCLYGAKNYQQNWELTKASAYFCVLDKQNNCIKNNSFLCSLPGVIDTCVL